MPDNNKKKTQLDSNSNSNNKKLNNTLSGIFGRKLTVSGSKPKLEVPDKTKVSYSDINKDARKSVAPSFIKTSSRVDNLWNYFLSQCHDSNDSFKVMTDVYKDMDYMYFNSPIYSRAVELYADEIVQVDSQQNIIEAFSSDSKIENEINDMFTNLSIPEKIRSTGRSLVHKGNACWNLGTKEGQGVIEVNQTKIEHLKQRMEFTPLEIETDFINQQSMADLAQNSIRLKQMIADIENYDDSNAIFKKYLLGYQINDFMVSPWSVLHFRNKVYDSVFDPFGMPLMINMVAPFRMYDSAMTMHTIARSLKFPREKIEVDLPKTHPTEMMEQLLEFATEYENSGLAEKENTKQEFTWGSKEFTIKGLYDVSYLESRQNLDDIADVTLLKDNLILASGIPLFIFDPNSSGGYNSGISLVQQYKPFGRAVFSQQNSILEELTLMIKIHLAFKGLDPESEFELNMPFPQAEQNPDLIRNKGDQLRFANDIIATLKDNVLNDREATLPPDVLKMIYMSSLPFTDEEIEKLVDDALKAKPRPEEQPTNNQPQAQPKTESKYKNILRTRGLREADNYVRNIITTKEIKKVEYEERRKRNWLEGIKDNRHFFNCNNASFSLNAKSLFLKGKNQKILTEMDNTDIRALLENFGRKNRKLFKA